MLYSGDFKIKDKTTRSLQKKMLPQLKIWNYNISRYSFFIFFCPKCKIVAVC